MNIAHLVVRSRAQCDLAAIKRHLENGPAAPVIVDDILVQFDDERAGAAFEALGQLAMKTQVLLFTHHDHLVPIARKAVTAEKLALHELVEKAPSR